MVEKIKVIEDFRDMDPWRIFRIMAEFVDGFDVMAKVGPAVTIFGSARTDPEHKYYEWGVTLGKAFTDLGYHIITGGGPGIMEAANRGAIEGKQGLSVGLNIDLPYEQAPNKYIETLLSFRYFFCRKVMFSKYAGALIVLPGGFGTMDEMFENLTLIQTNKIPKMPVVIMGKDFWGGMLDWLRQTVLEQEHNIDAEDLDLFMVTDDPEETVQYVIERFPLPQGKK